jgi:hypothetical protein
MPIEHFTAGRKYTERHFITQVGDPTEEDIREMRVARGVVDKALTLQGKLDRIIAHAMWTLEWNGMPTHDLTRPPYTAEWLSKNMYRSLEWYARELLLMIVYLYELRARGDYDRAMAQCIAIGQLGAEFCMMEARIQAQSEAGRKTRDEISQKHTAWRQMALEIWAKHPMWSTTRVARMIGRTAGVSHETVRPVIRDLNPKRAQK